MFVTTICKKGRRGGDVVPDGGNSGENRKLEVIETRTGKLQEGGGSGAGSSWPTLAGT